MDAIALAVLQSALAGVAEEMGAVLQRSAYSANIKERRDHSAALFDVRGRMVAQAAHIPVHLGAMPPAVHAVIALEPRPGEVWCLNDPFIGGTHLPDITLVSPVADGERIVAYAVTRAHHSDVGGMRPGSLPTNSTELLQEGIVIPPIRLVVDGRLREDLLELLLANMRTPEVRMGDLRAQLASAHVAEERLSELVRRLGADALEAGFDAVLEYAERRARAALAEVPDGVYHAEDALEGDGITTDDIPIRATVTIAGDGMTVDFTGTAPQTRGNVNCAIGVCRSSCCFALRILLPADVPQNDGAYAPLTLVAPPGSLVNAQRPAAVVAGNTETSQRIADVVLAALAQAVDLPAQGQGTLNNTVLGGAGYTYYETIGGGQGASSRGPGPSGVHVGMSNTLNTPVEALELDHPLRIRRYELRYGTGGDGAHRGGDGIVREVEVLAPSALSLITERRRHAPRGAAGGGDGAVGRNLVNGEVVGAKAGLDLAAGDVVTVETPGGGGFGRPSG
jgi:N-methylhydantoinase B